MVGVYSFSTMMSFGKQNEIKADMKRAQELSGNVVVSVESVGKRRIISFHSGLEFVNNMDDSIVLVFEVNKLSKVALAQKQLE